MYVGVPMDVPATVSMVDCVAPLEVREAAVFSRGVRELRGSGQRLSIREIETGTGWTITLGADGFDVAREALDGDATIVGPPLELLLTLYRRQPLGATSVFVEGDEALAAFWLAHSALE